MEERPVARPARRALADPALAGGRCSNACALAMSWSIFRAGFASASDPAAVIGPQRQRIERGKLRGLAEHCPDARLPGERLTDHRRAALPAVAVPFTHEAHPSRYAPAAVYGLCAGWTFPNTTR